jgi:hypothetical protein
MRHRAKIIVHDLIANPFNSCDVAGGPSANMKKLRYSTIELRILAATFGL